MNMTDTYSKYSRSNESDVEDNKEDADDMEDRIAVLEYVKNFRVAALFYIRPKVTVSMVDYTPKDRCFFSRPSAVEQEDIDFAEDKTNIILNAAALKNLAVDYTHPDNSSGNVRTSKYGKYTCTLNGKCINYDTGSYDIGETVALLLNGSTLVVGSKIDCASSGDSVSNVLVSPDNSMKITISVPLTSVPYVDMGDDNAFGAGIHYASYTINDKMTPGYKVVASRVILDTEKAKERNDEQLIELVVGQDEYILMEYLDGV